MNPNKTEPEKYQFTTQAIEDDITYNPILSIDMDDEITELLTGLKKLNTFKRETVTFVETMTAVDPKIYNEATKMKTYPFIIYLNFRFYFFYK